MLEDDFSGLGSLTQVRTYAGRCEAFHCLASYPFPSFSIHKLPQKNMQGKCESAQLLANFVMFKSWIFGYGGFLKCWYPTTMSFPTKNDHFGVFWGYHHLRKHPYGYHPNWEATKISSHGWMDGAWLPSIRSQAQDDEWEPGDAAGGQRFEEKLCEADRFFYRRMAKNGT